ncbi:hypothetical protein GMST_19000 [Geomonas silvestris]|uniref:Oxygen sensor histidine kinase NreB n=1 Tax=Geomonas silvestris TaxID=2740184 RepID=A0A6V8MHW1_9BACT|nr:PAS domain-containing protein [Geomonas silvestris]GFO59575.1 hypothetical protein GMST_19000 [Geomonas silvestris]
MNNLAPHDDRTTSCARFYDLSPVPHIALTGAGTIVDLNGAAGELLGSHTARPGVSLAAAVAEQDLPAFRDFLGKIMAGDSAGCTVTLLRAGAAPVSLRLAGRHVAGADLVLVALFELSGPDHQPREMLERGILKVIDEQTNIVICVKDREGRVRYLNQAMSRFLGRSPEEVLGRCDLEPIADAEQVVQIRANDRRIMDTGCTECFEESGTSAAGPWTYLFTKSPYLDRAGNSVGVVGIGLDITARKKAEETLKRYAQRLIVVEDELRKGIAMELHDDVGQELTALTLNLAIIGRNLGADAAQALRGTMEDSRQLIKAIHRSVRSLMVSLHPTQLEEYGLVSAVLTYAKQYQERTGIAVTVKTAPDFPRLASGREIALFRITQEALNNVLKHAEATEVSIVLTRDTSSVRLCLVDNGKGLALPHGFPRLTETGWGLTIMRERAELVGGRFAIASEAGRGSTITIEFDEVR